jgi:hypothetical protein
VRGGAGAGEVTEAEADAEAKRLNTELGYRPDGKGGYWHVVEVEGVWQVQRVIDRGSHLGDFDPIGVIIDAITSW